MAATAVGPGQFITMQDAASAAGNGTVIAPAPSINKHIFYVVGATGATTGAVSIETAADPEYAGTWAPLVNDLATPTTNPVVVTTAAVKIYKYDGALPVARARISTTVASTTVTVIYYGVQT